MADEKDRERERREQEERERMEEELRRQHNGGMLPVTHEQLQKMKKA
jgi:hypothetical protein